MRSLTKSNRFNTFRKKYMKDPAIKEILEYISILEDQIGQLERMVIALEKKDENDELHG